jgi:hypothetical protein
MRYFFTRRLQHVYYAIIGALEILALIGWLARLWDPFLVFIPVLPMYFFLFWLDDHKPPLVGDVRYRHINYYQPMVWNGKEWIEGKQA